MSKNFSSSGASAIDNFTIALISLKLAGFIDWPWWQVFIPAAAYIGLVILVALVTVLVIGLRK